jgi:hypothetical protein
MLFVDCLFQIISSPRPASHPAICPFTPAAKQQPSSSTKNGIQGPTTYHGGDFSCAGPYYGGRVGYPTQGFPLPDHGNYWDPHGHQNGPPGAYYGIPHGHQQTRRNSTLECNVISKWNLYKYQFHDHSIIVKKRHRHATIGFNYITMPFCYKVVSYFTQ